MFTWPGTKDNVANSQDKLNKLSDWLNKFKSFAESPLVGKDMTTGLLNLEPQTNQPTHKMNWCNCTTD